jgi:hypothetical protein
MNLYFIVEGVTESKVYPSWLSYLLPELERIRNASKALSNSNRPKGRQSNRFELE